MEHPVSGRSTEVLEARLKHGEPSRYGGTHSNGAQEHGNGV